MFDKSEKTFPAKKNANFLAHCSISPVYDGAARAMTGFVEAMASGGISALPRYLNVLADFHGNVARLLRTSEKNISYVHNSAEGLSMIANGYPFVPGDQVISYIHEYPSNHFPWALQKGRGVELLMLVDVAQLDEMACLTRPNG